MLELFPVLFSCKISNSIFSFLEQNNVDYSSILETLPVQEEFLRDSSYWLQANQMESLVSFANNLFHSKYPDADFLQKVGHSSSELKSWGVLNSVLRMISSPKDIFVQPQKFVSYFVSPAPPIDCLVHHDSAVSFDLPISSEIYPMVTGYLAAAFESLPTFVGQQMGRCQWNDIHFKLDWANEQNSIFSGDEPSQRQLSPELMQNIIVSLERQQKELEEKNHELQNKNSNALAMPQDSLQTLHNNLSKMQDYMVRAQQLITLLVAQDRMNATVAHAMKKVDWENVKTNYGMTIKESQQILNSIKK